MRRPLLLFAAFSALLGCVPTAPATIAAPPVGPALEVGALTVTTLAGGPAGDADGPAASARFFRPHAIAFSPDGTLYVADSGNDRIRKVAPDGAVSTVATSAPLDHPTGLAVSADGTLYVTELHHNRIVRIAPDGAVSTHAGADAAGFADGPASAARFSDPLGLGLAPDGALYVADSRNDRIRRVAPDGSVSTVAGSGAHGDDDGPVAEASFISPVALAVAPDGAFFVAEHHSHEIRKVVPGGVVTTIAGDGEAGFADGQGQAARFNAPSSLAVDAAGSVYVADADNHRIRRIAPDGSVTTLAGRGAYGAADGPANQASFSNPFGLALRADGTLVVADTHSHRLRAIR